MLKLISLKLTVGDIHSLVWIREWFCHITKLSISDIGYLLGLYKTANIVLPGLMT